MQIHCEVILFLAQYGQIKQIFNQNAIGRAIEMNRICRRNELHLPLK